MEKALVAYFSASGLTAKLAANLAESIGAELFEIRPVEPYTKADIKWTNPLARCNREKIGKKDVPIEGIIEDFNKYDTVFIGFPIWYYAEPNIIDTFVKDYDFTGKKIALFATSGGSDITKAPGKMAPLVAGEIVGAKLFKYNEDQETLRRWAESL